MGGGEAGGGGWSHALLSHLVWPHYKRDLSLAPSLSPSLFLSLLIIYYFLSCDHSFFFLSFVLSLYIYSWMYFLLSLFLTFFPSTLETRQLRAYYSQQPLYPCIPATCSVVFVSALWKRRPLIQSEFLFTPNHCG